jgi:hypothetical protein
MKTTATMPQQIVRRPVFLSIPGNINVPVSAVIFVRIARIDAVNTKRRASRRVSRRSPGPCP